MRPLASAVSSSLVGQVIDGKYAIVSRIAEGGTSTVYLGVNQRIGKDVAVKVLRTPVACDPEARERFEREARIVSRIRSAHVADVFDFGELPTGERFMVMEYLEGESLAKLIQRDEPMSADTLGIITLQILDALAAAHSVGVVHRDLKPENVLVATRRGELVAKVVDFGISKIDGALSVRSPNLSTAKTNGSDGTESRLTVSGSVLGTPLYMSPEQASGETGSVDRRTDIYSLGVILYEALCGEPPITGDEMNELLFRIVLEDPRPLAERVPTVDRGLAAIVERALAKDPNDRYQTADEMRLALEKWRARAAVPVGDVVDEVKETAAADALSSSDVFARFGRVRRWALAALFAASAAVVGVPFVVGLMGSSESKTQSPPPPAPSPAPESTGVRTSELSIQMARTIEGAAYSRRSSIGSARASRAGEQQEKQ